METFKKKAKHIKTIQKTTNQSSHFDPWEIAGASPFQKHSWQHEKAVKNSQRALTKG